MRRNPSKSSGVSESNADTQRGPDFAARLRGFGPVGIIAILLILFTGNLLLGNVFALPVGAILTLAWVYFSHTPWREIGYVQPGNWISMLVGGFLVGTVLKLVTKIIIMPMLGANPVNSTYHFLVGNQALLPIATLSMFVAGFAEETVYRGYLFERLGKLFGSSTTVKTFIVLLTSVLFGIGHLGDQGIAGMEQALVTGLTFGTIYAVTGRIFFVMMAHTAYDLVALAMIYSGTEANFAHFVFK
jgi:membrane protease YdiL (CAAX protease family)